MGKRKQDKIEEPVAKAADDAAPAEAVTTPPDAEVRYWTVEEETYYRLCKAADKTEKLSDVARRLIADFRNGYASNAQHMAARVAELEAALA